MDVPVVLLDEEIRGLDSTPIGLVEQARMQLREHAKRTKQTEVDEAVSKLEAHGDLTAAQRETVVRMATRITERILASPEAELNGTAETEKCAEVVHRLFEPDDGERDRSDIDG